MWVRFSGLPTEYYDPKVLKFIGNRIGRTVKVDKTTEVHKRGKYTRVCVEVDLTKPLLAMFTIKDRDYKVEYEGLHLLCLSCGKFGHHVEGCLDKTKPGDGGHASAPLAGTGQQGVGPEAVVEGPWTVVQKPQRPRRKDFTLPAVGVRRCCREQRTGR